MATIYWRGRCAYLNWRENGRQWRRSLGEIEPAEAKNIRLAKEAELATGVRIYSTAPRLDEYLEDYLEWYEAEHPTTIRKARSAFKPLLARFGAYAIDAIPPRELETWKALRLGEVKPESVSKELRLLKAALNRAVALELITKNTAALVKVPRGVTSKAVKFYAREDLQKLYAASARHAEVWRFMANTGLRRGEMLKAQRSDVVTHGRERVIRIESEEGSRSKSGRWREVPLNGAARAAMKALGRKGKLVPGMGADSLSQAFARDAAKAGVGGNLHMLRHSFCAHLVSAGVPLRTVQLLAGHSSYTITERYAHLAPGRKNEAVGKIDL